MDARRFEALLDAYGAEPRRWPADRRAQAEAFASTAEGRSLLAEARRLDQQLDISSAPRPSPELRARVLAAAPRPGARLGLADWLAPLRGWAPGAGLAAAGLAGVLFGATLSGSGPDPRVEMLLAEAGAYDEVLLLETAP